jgi:integrase/ribosomal protein L40E
MNEQALLHRIQSRDFPQENKDLILKFYKELEAKNKSKETRICYLVILERLACFLPNKTFKEMSKDDLVEFFSKLKPKEYREVLEENEIKKEEKYRKIGKYSFSTIQKYQIAIKKFFQWLYGYKRGVYPECVDWIEIEKKTKLRLPEDMLTQEEIKRLLEVCDHPRDRALIMVLYETGGRPSEVAGLKLKDVKEDQYGLYVILPDKKTGQRRIRLLNSVPDLKLWLNMHSFKDNPENPLFYRIGKKWWGKCCFIGRDGIYLLLRRLLKRAKINKRVTPYLFRHTRLTELAKMGFRESELRILAGWSGDSRMPKVYIHLSGEDVDQKFLELNGKIVKREKQKSKLEPKVCIKCGEENPVGMKYCLKCGYPLDKRAIDEVERAKYYLSEVIKKLMSKPELLKSLDSIIEES